VSKQRWPASWYELRAARGCGMCANQGLEDNGWGLRFLEGAWADVFLWRSGSVRGYSVAIWKHQHVAEPTRLPADQEERLQADVRALRSVVADLDPAGAPWEP
jgi:hypothetical protein